MTAPVVITVSGLVSILFGLDIGAWAVGALTGAVAMMVDGGRW